MPARDDETNVSGVKGAYLIGAPGAGKSTTVANLIRGSGTEGERRTKPFAHTIYRDADGRTVAAQIGGHHDTFPGTDRLSMSVQPKAIEWVEGAPVPMVFGEGTGWRPTDSSALSTTPAPSGT